MTFSPLAKAAMRKLKSGPSHYDPNQPRDPHSGEWTSAGGSSTSVASRLAPAKNLFARIAAADGGFTYHPLTDAAGIEPIRGFAVSPYPHLSFAKSAKEFSLGDLAAYVKKNRKMLSNPDHFIGAWHDPATGRIFLDVSVVTNSAGIAHKLAAQHDQIAYFDLARGKSVTVNKHATSGGVA